MGALAIRKGFGRVTRMREGARYCSITIMLWLRRPNRCLAAFASNFWPGGRAQFPGLELAGSAISPLVSNGTEPIPPSRWRRPLIR